MAIAASASVKRGDLVNGTPKRLREYESTPEPAVKRN
jgi:hypothetical protein